MRTYNDIITLVALDTEFIVKRMSFFSFDCMKEN